MATIDPTPEQLLAHIAGRPLRTGIHSDFNACMYRAGCQQTEAAHVALLAEAEALRKDAERLAWLVREECVPDGFVGVSLDRYEYAMDVAAEAGREEPTESDSVDGFRRLVDAAMVAAPAVGAA